MAYLKLISCHVSCKAIKSYLEHDGRALAADYQNLSAPVVGYGLRDLRCYGCCEWAKEMDDTRRDMGNDQAWGDRPTRTFLHGIISPDPRDNADLHLLRLVATSWVQENFPDHQAALVYHNDNEHQVLHAHVIVNNTNLKSGRRFSPVGRKTYSESLQRIAREAGLSFFYVGQDGDPHIEERTLRRAFGRTERELISKGSYSWVADIRARVDIARDSSSSERKFFTSLMKLGVTIRDARARKSGGWVYALATDPSHEVSGAHLGTIYTRDGVRARLGSPVMRPLPRNLASNVQAAAKNIIELGSLAELRRLALTVDIVHQRGLTHIDGFDRLIANAKERKCSVECERLRDARACCEEYGLLLTSVAESSPLPRSKAHKTKRRKITPSQYPSTAAAQVQRMFTRQVRRDKDDRGELR